MSQEEKIKTINKLSPVYVSTYTGEPGELKKAPGEVRPIAELAVPRESAFMRTLKGRNKTGKAIYGLLTIAVSMLTGVNVSPLTHFLTTPLTQPQSIMDINWITIVSWLVIGAGTFLTSRGLIKGLLNDILQEVKDIVEAVKKAHEASSPGGKEYTPEEIAAIMQHVDTLVMTLYKRLLRSRLARVFGLEYQIKKPEDNN